MGPYGNTASAIASSIGGLPPGGPRKRPYLGPGLAQTSGRNLSAQALANLARNAPGAGGSQDVMLPGGPTMANDQPATMALSQPSIADYLSPSIAGSMYQPGMMGSLPGGATQSAISAWAQGKVKNMPLPAFSFDSGPYAQAIANDPLLNALQSQAGRDLTSMRGLDWSQRASLLEAFGDPKLAASVLGSDFPDLSKISSDPNAGFSTLSQIAKAYNDNVTSAEDALNKNNLAYGGWRGKTLGNLSYADQQSIAQATSALQGQLSGLDRADMQAQQTYMDLLMQGFSDAYSRAIAAALANAGAGGAGAGGVLGGPGNQVPYQSPMPPYQAGIPGYATPNPTYGTPPIRPPAQPIREPWWRKPLP